MNEVDPKTSESKLKKIQQDTDNRSKVLKFNYNSKY